MTAGRRTRWRTRLLSVAMGGGAPRSLGPVDRLVGEGVTGEGVRAAPASGEGPASEGVPSGRLSTAPAPGEGSASEAVPGGRMPTASAPGEGVVGECARVLVIRPDHLGDVLFVGPALARLRAARPQAHVTLLVGPWATGVAEHLADVDRLLALDFPWFDRRPRGAPWRPFVRLRRSERWLAGQGPFDVAIVLRDDDYWSAWLAARAGVPVRVTHDHPSVRPFATHVVPAATRQAHACAAGIALVDGAVGSIGPTPTTGTHPLVWRATEDDRLRAAALLGEAVAGGGRGPVAVHPGSGAAVKRWRPDGWADAIRALTAPGETVVLTGATDERPLVTAVAERIARPTLDLTGLTDIGSLAAVFARCRLVLGPDSGPLHLAVAVGTPTVHLFGPADPARFGPWGPPGRHRVVTAGLPCAPCGRLDWADVADHPCIRAIEVTSVIAAAREAVAGVS